VSSQGCILQMKIQNNRKRTRNFSKKGQFFILVAVIVCMILFLLVQEYNYVRTDVALNDYAELKDNYNSELPKIMNRALYITKNSNECKNPDNKNCPVQAVQEFSDEYQKYAAQKDPGFGLVSVIRDPISGAIIVQNLLPEGQYIKIDDKRYNGETLKVLFSESTTSKGTVSIKGLGNIGQTSVNAPVSSFGENFTRVDLGNAQSFDIIMSDGTRIPFTNIVAVKSLSKTSREYGRIDVDVCPGGPRC